MEKSRLSMAGPVVCVANREDRSRPARLKVVFAGPESRQQTVADLIGLAAAVLILVTDSSAGIEFELETLQSVETQRKTVALCRREARANSLRAAGFDHVLPSAFAHLLDIRPVNDRHRFTGSCHGTISTVPQGQLLQDEVSPDSNPSSKM